jgi:hypothetical protein
MGFGIRNYLIKIILFSRLYCFLFVLGFTETNVLKLPKHQI